MEFRQLESEFTQWEYFFADRKILDISKPESIDRVLGEINPDVVINCAAYTNVELAESEPEKAFETNALSPAYLAGYCKNKDILLIHFSTDYVFDGTKNSPYKESDITNPLNVYGKSKLAGEQKIESINPQYFIIRISWLYGTFGKNFYKTMLRLADENKEIKVVDDQTGSPTYSRILANDILTMIDRINKKIIEPKYGIYHYTNDGNTNWFSFASEILRHYNITPIAVSSDQFPTKAIRPQHSKLDTTLWEQSTGIPITEWKVALQHCIKEETTIRKQNH